MAITVKLTDAMVSLGGDFAVALARVKAISGRAYESSTKTWSVPQTLLQFQKEISGLPFDVLSATNAARSGQHVTRHGNKYSSAEWAAKRAVDALVVPAEIVARVEAREQAAWQAFVAVIGDEAKARQVSAVLQRYESAAEAEEYGRIKFSSPARRAEIDAAWDAYQTALFDADGEAKEWIDAETHRIYDGTELY